MTAPLDDLRHEHRLIGRALTVLERFSQMLNEGRTPPPDTLAQAVEFVRGFADRCHHGKEEHALFPLLASKRPILKRGPVKVLTAEHEAGRKLIGDLDAAIGKIRTGDERGRREAAALTERSEQLEADMGPDAHPRFEALIEAMEAAAQTSA